MITLRFNDLPAVAPPGTAGSAVISIHQIFYADRQRSRLEPTFRPFDNRANPDPVWREYHVFRSEYFRGKVAEDAITGYVSWKFRRKARLSGLAFRDFIARHPGADVYCVSPPGIEPRPFRNVWVQGEYHHPGIIHLAREVFRRVGIDCDPETVEMPESRMLYCNYWAGTRRFWDLYMAFCEPVRDCLLHGLDAADRRLLHTRADAVIDACFIPFIMERLFSTLLAVRPDITCRSWNGIPDDGGRGWLRGLWAS